MLQRIQHIFLLLSAVATGLMIFKPLVSIEVAGGESAFMFAGAIRTEGAGETILSCIPLMFLICLITAISLLTIFLYKKRLLQMRFTVYNMILMVGLIVLGYYYASKGANEISGDIQLTFYTVMPVVSFILSLLAWRGVRRDYLMLKAVERIR